MPAQLEVTYYPTADLRLYHRNPRVGNVDRIKQSLTVNTQYKPICVNVGTHTGRPLEVLAGNHTVKAARDLGWETIAAVTVDVDDDQAVRIVAADNRTSDLGTYDDRLLLELLADLDTLDGTGYDPADIAALERALAESEIPPAGRTDPDDVPDIAATITTQPGDLWMMGPHRLLCGDATNPEHLDRATDGVPIGIVYTDPPYGIHAVPKDGGVSRGKLAPANRYEQVAGDDCADTARDAFSLLTATYPEERQVWWGGNHYVASAALPDSSCWLIWDKDNHGNDFADAELAWTNHTGAVRLLQHTWNGMIRASERGKRVHPTQKPVALAVWAFETVHADKDTAVLDVFAGSGSTLIAAHQTGRTSFLIEMEPAYCDVILRRYQEHTGVTPTRDGVPHDFTQQP